MKKKLNQEKLNSYIKFAIILSLILFMIGVLGFYLFHKHDWIEAIYDTTAIMSAVGAADEPTNDSGKIFASFYTLAIGLGYIFLISSIITTSIVSQFDN